MRYTLILTALLTLVISGCKTKKNLQMQSELNTPFELNTNTTPTYLEVIQYYSLLSEKYPELMEMNAVGSTDAGFPLHEIVVSRGGKTPDKAISENKVVLFINNAIHPGEPCGVDASMVLLRDILSKPEMSKLLDHAIIVMVPFYNIGGGLNRGGFSRANQEGPELHGFRGNTRNLDLNRDFIKCDSRNAKTFNQLFTKWNAPIFIDNHTSNGADYQYVMTLIATQKDKLQEDLSRHMENSMLPDVYKRMKEVDYEMIPYVNVRNTPDEGIYAFLDLPRYSSGFAVLHNCISFMPETHMLKSYKERVESTYAYMKAMLQHIEEKHFEILKAKQKADRAVKDQKSFDINWVLDPSKAEKIQFKGYEARYKPSKVSGLSRLYYDHNAPWTKEIPFYNTYKASKTIEAPQAYIFPQAYSEIVDRLRWNGVQVETLEEDQAFEVSRYSIEDFETTEDAYEGHYLHYNISTKTMDKETLQYRKGDFIVYVNQGLNRYIVETLEPEAPDSFFAWNFFDGILMQKEYFSPYVFEDTAADLLEKDKSLRRALDKAIEEDPSMQENARAQLMFVYKNSPYYESSTHRIYPVGRIEY